MSKINILPDNLANQISAGEVVERPASVVKELVENSIDAQATRISIDIELGGRRLIRIDDDGIGMDRDDAILSFERHATSKIRTEDDLASIGTLGFRGEALASIASVAKVELMTKTEDELAATRVVIEGGRLLDVKDASRDRGTTFTIRDLFFNTPARRKFMRSEATENYHLTNIVTHYALSHPEIAFTLTNNGREVIRATPARDLRERAFQLFGGSMIDSLLSVEGGREFVAKVSGFISAPRERRTTRDSQYFFVNQRFVRDKAIAGGLLEGYRSVLPHGVYPVAFLFIELPLEEVDVNVHPAKTEVRFRRREAVKEVIAEAVRSALTNAGITGDREGSSSIESEIPNNIEQTSSQQYPTVQPRQPEMGFSVPNSTSPPAILEFNEVEVPPIDSNSIPDGTSAADVNFQGIVSDDGSTIIDEGLSVPEDRYTASGYAELPPVDSAAHLARSIEVKELNRSKIKPIGQLHNSFIIAVDDEGLLLVDQHVAHERILFDKFRDRETARSIESQHLLLPETIDLTPAQAQAFEMINSELEELGFDVMRLSGRTIAIKSIPTDVQPAEVRNLFAEILDSIDGDKKNSAKLVFRDEIAASLACKAAVKINMQLTTEKMHWLIDRLLLTTSPTTCPHGRPVVLRLSMKDIERGFHRT